VNHFSGDKLCEPFDDILFTGGASNTGCKILRDEKFSEDELVTLSEGIDPQSCSGFTYYPLSTQGERFPINDPRYVYLTLYVLHGDVTIVCVITVSLRNDVLVT
jgi:hypothetical protein